MDPMDGLLATPPSRKNDASGSLTIGEDARLALTPLGREMLTATEDRDEDDG